MAIFDILILDKSPIKWRQRTDMTIAVDCDAEPQVNSNENHFWLTIIFKTDAFIFMVLSIFI